MGRLLVALIVSSWVIPISILVNRIVPDPYMDEIFHVPQAQQYCKGNFRSWDPMITTPPGLLHVHGLPHWYKSPACVLYGNGFLLAVSAAIALSFGALEWYYISLAHVGSLFPGTFLAQATPAFSDACSTAILRSTNAVLAVVCSVLIYDIIIQLRPALDERKATLFAVVLALYPIHWFFTFLYYTDVASLAAVLFMYHASLRRSYFFSALLGSMAVLIRQTNIIWVLFVASSGVIDSTLACRKANVLLDNSVRSSREDFQLLSEKGVRKASNLRKRRLANAVGSINYSTETEKSGPSTTCSPGLLNEFRDLVVISWHQKWDLLASFSPFFLVLLAFIAFVRWNGSIVLGAKEAHTVSPHFAQMMYFSLVSALLMAPFLARVSQTEALIRWLWKTRPLSFFQCFIGLAAGFLSVHFFSVAHPYLLADNRHYTFYLWRKVINAHPSMKYLLVPVYVYSWFSFFQILARCQKKIWVLSFFLASAAVLIPTPLIELRYYTIPFFFLVLHSFIDDCTSWIFLGILYTAINAFTMIMFLFRPFSWSHEPGVQRFIW